MASTKLVIVSIFLIFSVAFAQSNNNDSDNDLTLSVTGTGEVQAQPDRASVTVGVELRNRTVQGVARAVDLASSSVISILKDNGVEDEDIQTSYVNLQPVYSQPTNQPVPIPLPIETTVQAAQPSQDVSEQAVTTAQAEQSPQATRGIPETPESTGPAVIAIQAEQLTLETPENQEIQDSEETQSNVENIENQQNQEAQDRQLIQIAAPIPPSQPSQSDRGYQIIPDYYTASKTVTFILRDLTRYDQIMTALYDAGINSVNGVNFELENQEDYQQQARKKAVANARAIAEALTSGLGVRLGNVRAINDQTSGGGGGIAYAAAPQSAQVTSAYASSSSGPSVAGGQITVSSSVGVTFTFSNE